MIQDEFISGHSVSVVMVEKGNRYKMSLLQFSLLTCKY
jgi:hypothetical protein